jgi:bacillolysin
MRRGFLSWLAAVLPTLAVPPIVVAAGAPIRVTAASAPSLDEWSGRVDGLLASGDLRVRLVREDTMVPGRQHERLAQFYRGVPVFGGELIRQSDASGTLTVFGTLYEGIHLDVTPRLGPRDVEALLAGRGGRPFGTRGGPELVVLPLAGGGYRLVYRTRALFEEALDVRQCFFDATTGAIVREYRDLQTQAAGIGTGVLGDRKKISVTRSGSEWSTSDRLRPPAISTYSFRFDVNRLILFLNADGRPSNLTAADLGLDSDNVWTDGALVDAHVYAGYVYDYYYERFGRRGLDDANIAIHSITHALRRDDWRFYSTDTVGTFFANAFYLGDGVMYYGDGLPPSATFFGYHFNYLAGGLDVVAHELTHGVTDYTSRLVYEGESGALNEAFSDIMGTAVEFFAQPEKADYLAGEDVVTPGGLRSLQNPTSYGYPDHVRDRYRGRQDNGGVHTNSTIVGHAFYLAIEGGRHRLGTLVQGVGGDNRDQVERIFYRAFTSFLAPSAGYVDARDATIEAARELYGVGSPAERAIVQAWTAVGLGPNVTTLD